VFALPGSIHAALSKGCHQLIRDGAQLVDSVDDVLLALSMAPLVGQAAAAPAAPVPASPLLAILGDDPLHIDAILAHGTMTFSALSAELLALEMAGIVARLPGGLLQRVHR